MTSVESQRAFLDLVREGPGHITLCNQTGLWREERFESNEEVTIFADKYWSTHEIYVALNTPSAEATTGDLEEESRLRALWVQVEGQDGIYRKTDARIIAEFEDMIKRTGLPSPNIHHSTGDGVDFYWAFKQPISNQQWESLAKKLYQLITAGGVQISQSIPEPDAFLRLPGTRNLRHRDDPFDTEITIISDKPLSTEELQEKMDRAMTKFYDRNTEDNQTCKPVPDQEPQGSLSNQDIESKGQERLITRAASSYAPQPTEWLIDQSIPFGEVAVIAGEPGLGKSQIALRLAAAVSTGHGLPEGEVYGNPGSAIILANEDDAERTIRPRLDAAGANLEKVHIVEGVARSGQAVKHFQLDSDIEDLADAAKRLGDVRLIVIDPPSAYLGPKTDSYKEQDVRGILTPLKTLARETGCLILLIVHLNKRNEGSAQQRIAGSTAWTAAPRAAFMAVEDPTTGKRYLLPAKSNNGNDKVGFEFQIIEKTIDYPGVSLKSSYIDWLERTELTANKILNHGQASSISAVNDASKFLHAELRSGERPVDVILEMAAARSISKASLERAKRKIGVKSIKKGRDWYWCIADDQDEVDAHSAATDEPKNEPRF